MPEEQKPCAKKLLAKIALLEQIVANYQAKDIADNKLKFLTESYVSLNSSTSESEEEKSNVKASA